MDRLEKEVLKQLNGQRARQLCPVCKKETWYIYHNTGKANCTICKNEVEIDLTNLIKDLKKRGVYVD